MRTTKSPHDAGFVLLWCPRGDSNPHTLRRYHLKVVRLPIPPPGLIFRTLPSGQCFSGSAGFGASLAPSLAAGFAAGLSAAAGLSVAAGLSEASVAAAAAGAAGTSPPLGASGAFGAAVSTPLMTPRSSAGCCV